MNRVIQTILTLLLLMPPAFAQVVLRQSADLPDRYIVTFVDLPADAVSFGEHKGAAIKALREQQARRIAQLRQDLRDSNLEIDRNLWIRQAVAISIAREYLPRIRSLSYVAEVRVDPQYVAVPQGVVTLPLSGVLAQDNLERVDVDQLWSEQYRGQGVVVAIMDSGVDPLHDDLSGRWRGGSNSWFDPYQQQPVPKDLTGHGTAVASIVLGGDAAGSHIGMAPNAQWIAARIFNNSGSSSESAISAALQWLVDPDGDPLTDDYPDIVQNSWGLDGTEGSCLNPFAPELALIDALGIDIVFAVGNSGLSGPELGGFSSFLIPAGDSHVISVGALRATDVLLYASSRGPDRCGSATIPALVAPGELIRTANITFGGFDNDATTVNTGTSFSSPHVSGALALLRSKFSATSYQQYRSAIFNSTIDLGNAGIDADYGRGKLQASAASTWLANQSVPLRSGEVGFSNARYAFSEADTGARIVVLRSGDLNDSASVDIHSVDGTAISPADYQSIMTTLNFAAGESEKTVDILPVNNSAAGADKTFSLVLTQNVNINLGARPQLVVTLIDDESAAQSEENLIGGAALGIMELMLFGLFWLGRRVWA
jgi:subtilisin family serine protease